MTRNTKPGTYPHFQSLDTSGGQCHSLPLTPQEAAQSKRFLQKWFSVVSMGFRISWRVGVFGALMAAAVALRLTFAAVSVQQLPPTSDEGLSLLLAKRIAGGHLPLLMSAQPYLFPVESYLLAPFVHALPRNALGARALPLLLGFATFALLLLCLRRAGSLRTTWPGMLLLLFPSAYLLMLQAAYPVPQYATLMLLHAAVLFLAAGVADRRGPMRLAAAAAAGLLCGLAWSAYALVLPTAVGAALVFCLGRNWREALRGAPVFAAGLAIGLAPYVLAVHTIPGAYQGISRTFPLATALARLWHPTLAFTLPGTLGVNPVLFPDFKMHLAGPAALRILFAGIYVAVTAAVVGHRVWHFVQRVCRDRWPSFEFHDVIAAAAVLPIPLFALSPRANPGSYRYLIVAAWAFPFMVAYLCAVARPRPARWLAILAVLIAGFNLATSAAVIRAWRQPDFAARAGDVPDTRDLVADLRTNGIRHCYASMWLAYRLTYETDEQIVCSPPYNERFFGWSLPYRDIVDSATNTPFILTDTFGSRLTSSDFAADLEAFGITAKKRKVGCFDIYSDFFHPRSSAGDRAVSDAALAGSASVNPSNGEALSDGDHATAWSSGVAQSTGMWVQVAMKEPRRIQRITLFFPAFRRHLAQAVQVSVRHEGIWTTVRQHVPGGMDRLRAVSGRPVYGERQQTFWFDPVMADAVRVEIVEPTAERPWSITEIELGETGPDPVEASRDSGDKAGAPSAAGTAGQAR